MSWTLLLSPLTAGLDTLLCLSTTGLHPWQTALAPSGHSMRKDVYKSEGVAVGYGICDKAHATIAFG